MQEFCHRCGGELPEGSGESPFCPRCGAPQLSLALENQSVEASTETAEAAPDAASTGAIPPTSLRQVEWKTAIRCAAAVAAVGAALSVVAIRVDVLSPVRFLWIMCASLITLGFYQKRRPTAWMDVRVGARIGVVVGVCLALEVGTALAAAGLVARYGMHAMGNYDAQMAAQFVQMENNIQQKFAAQSTPMPAETVGFMRSPEFRGGMVLAGCAFLAAGLVVLSTLGGAFAGLLGIRRRPAA
ncbi:MAG: zinc ribbon domain-containing protein [Acidobacteriaceae bacterium]